MCLILLANNYHKKYPLIIAANRDEFYNRLSEPVHSWKEYPYLYAGKDIKEGGTWLGITKKGKIAAITNYRDLSSIKSSAPSRGNLVKDFLTSDVSPDEYSKMLLEKGNLYNGFNLIYGNINSLKYFSNITNNIEDIDSGIHGLSNHLLNTNWPKVELGKHKIETVLKKPEFNEDDLIKMLYDEKVASDDSLPDTGIGLLLERVLSPIFIKSEKYGTRCSSVLIVNQSNEVRFVESTFNPGSKTFSEVRINFKFE